MTATTPAAPASAIPFVALVLGALCMGISPTFVRLADVGPLASAFWRVGAALPLLFFWAAWEARKNGEPLRATVRMDMPIFVAGVAFALDLLFWHLAIVTTTVANATLLATMAPVWVVLGSSFFIGEAVNRNVVVGLVLCVAGAAALIGTSYSLSPEHLLGDVYGVLTSIFFGAYFLAVRRARRNAGTGKIIFLSGVVTAAILYVAAFVGEERILPQSMEGVLAILGIAYVSHVGGQGFLTFALGHLPAAFSSLVIFIEAPAAAIFAWAFLGEAVFAVQAAGGALIMAGLYVARPSRS